MFTNLSFKKLLLALSFLLVIGAVVLLGFWIKNKDLPDSLKEPKTEPKPVKVETYTVIEESQGELVQGFPEIAHYTNGSIIETKNE